MRRTIVFLFVTVLFAALGVSLAHALFSATGYWRFEEGSANAMPSGANSLLDSSGSGNHGTPSGSPFYRSDVPVSVIPRTGASNSLSMEFDTPDDSIFFPSQFVFNQPGDATLEFWLKYPPGATEALLWGRSDCDDANRFHMYILGDGKLRVDYRDSFDNSVHPVVGEYFGGGVPIPPNTWTHIALTRSGNTYRLYTDGILMSTYSDVSPALPTSSGWYLFWRCGLELTGSIDELRVSNVALVPGQFLNSPPTALPVVRYLRGIGLSNNPPTLFLDASAPTITTAKFKDSTAINFSGGNPWKEVGVWPAEPSLTAGALTALNDLRVWLGLKNSDDQGARFDLRAEVYKNGVLVTAGETYCIQGVTRNPNLAKEVIVAFAPFAPVAFDGATDELSLKVLTRIGSDGAGGFCGGHSNAVGLRLYFDSVSRPSRFNATIAP